MIQQFCVIPKIHIVDTCKEFCETFQVGKEDLILTNPTYFNAHLESYASNSTVVFLKKYGAGEPTDQMVEALYNDIKDIPFKRVIAVGGGSIIDVAKLLVQETLLPLEDLFDKKIQTKKIKNLVIVPTTCGTGSEVTSVSVIDMTCKGTKMGLQTEEEYADDAVLIPELLEQLTFRFFATSSIDALIHAIESFMSPKATPFSELFSEKAIRLILEGYSEILNHNLEVKKEEMKNFLLASTYAGIAFGNAGCAAVHAMSMPFSGAYHVPHGEANYVIFTGVFKAYNRLKPVGKIQRLNTILAEVLRCDMDHVYEVLEQLLNSILPKKSLHEYGVKESDLKNYVEIVMAKQGRLTANNYTELNEEKMLTIYQSLY